MRKPVLPHVPAIIKGGFEISRNHARFLLQISVLYGLLTSIALSASQQFKAEFIDALLGDAEDGASSAMVYAPQDVLSYIAGNALVYFIYAVFLVLWARKVSPDASHPLDGGLNALTERSRYAFSHIIKTFLLTAGIAVAAVVIIYTLSSLLGAAAFVVTIAVVIAAICSAVLVTAGQNIAVYYQAHDTRLTIGQVWQVVKPAAQPLFITMGFYMLATAFTLVALGGIFGETLVSKLPHTVTALAESLGFAGSALFVAAISRLNLR